MVMSRAHLNGADWATHVGEDEPHDLQTLEDRVLERAQRTAKHATHREGFSPAKAFQVFKAIFTIALFMGPIAAVTVFFNREDRVVAAYNFNTEFEFTAAAIGFALGGFLQIALVVEWWRSGRHHDNFTIGLSAFMLVCVLLTMVQAYAAAPGDSATATLYLIPAWLTGTVAIFLIVANLVSRQPAPDHDEDSPVWIPGVGNIQKLAPAAEDAIRQDRAEAIQILVKRGLLTNVDLAELSARPLGKLAGDQEL